MSSFPFVEKPYERGECSFLFGTRSYVRRQNVSAPKKTGNCILEESLIFFRRCEEGRKNLLTLKKAIHFLQFAKVLKLLLEPDSPRQCTGWFLTVKRTYC